MTQSRRASAFEAVLNVAIGYVLAVTAQGFIFHLFGLNVGPVEHLGIAACFTAVSLVRSYALRRVFNRFAVRK